MRYNFNGKSINIADDELKSIMALDSEMTKEEAIQIWLEDNEYLDNEEQNELQEKASAVKIDHGAESDKKQRKKSDKPKTVKVSQNKQDLFQRIATFLKNEYENVEILTENKLFQVKIGSDTFKIDVIQQRNKK